MITNSCGTINASGALVSESMLQATLMQSGLKWVMNDAQLHALQVTVGNKGFTIESQVTSETPAELVFNPHIFTLFGLPIMLASDNPHLILLVDKTGNELARLEGLAIPSAYFK